MPEFAPSFFDGFEDRLNLAVFDTNQELRTRRLTKLLDEAMKIRITEPVFFQGANRQVGDVLDVERGPYRKVQPDTYPSAYGYDLVPQFEELATEVHLTDTTTTPAPTPAPAPKSATQPKSVASMIKDLATRRNKFINDTRSSVTECNDIMTNLEVVGPQVIAQNKTIAGEELASFKELQDALQELAGSNGGPLSSS